MHGPPVGYDPPTARAGQPAPPSSRPEPSPTAWPARRRRTTKRGAPSRRHGVTEILRGERGRHQTQPHRGSFARIIVQVVHEARVPQSFVRSQVAGKFAPPPRHVEGHKLGPPSSDHLANTTRREIALVHHEGDVRVILHTVEQPGPGTRQDPEGSVFPEKPDRTHRWPARRYASGERLLQESVHIKTGRCHISHPALPFIAWTPTFDLRAEPQAPSTRESSRAVAGPFTRVRRRSGRGRTGWPRRRGGWPRTGRRCGWSGDGRLPGA